MQSRQSAGTIFHSVFACGLARGDVPWLHGSDTRRCIRPADTGRNTFGTRNTEQETRRQPRPGPQSFGPGIVHGIVAGLVSQTIRHTGGHAMQTPKPPARNGRRRPTRFRDPDRRLLHIFMIYKIIRTFCRSYTHCRCRSSYCFCRKNRYL